MPGADLPIIPKHIWENVTEPARFTADLPVGVRAVQGRGDASRDQRYRLEANANYFKGKPTIDRLELPIVKDPGRRLRRPPQRRARHPSPATCRRSSSTSSSTAGVEVAEGTKFESLQMYFNALKAPLTDAKLRKAISLAIDTKPLVDTVLLGHGRPGLDTFIHPDSPWAAPNGRHETDPAKAERMLDEAGYRTKDPDGVRKTPDGKRLEFSILVSSFEPTDLRAVQLAAQQVARIGVKLNPEALDPATLRTRRTGPPGQPPPYDAYMSTLESHGHVDPDALYYFFHSPGTERGFGASISGYTNPAYDKIVEEATTKDVAARKPLLNEAQRILARRRTGGRLLLPGWRLRLQAVGLQLVAVGQGPRHLHQALLPARVRQGEERRFPGCGRRGVVVRRRRGRARVAPSSP